MTPRMLCACALLAALPAAAQTIYKCEEDGKITYTDQPCSPGASAAMLPELIVTRPPSRSQRELAKAHDTRIARDHAERDRADADWVKAHDQRTEREARVRKAIIEHRVIRGMTAAEVRQALGEPERVQGAENFGTAKESWTYAATGRTVNFKDGEVISTSVKKKTRRGRR